MYSPHQQSSTAKLFGPVYTIQMVDAADTVSPRPSQHFVDAVTEGSVVFVSQPGGCYSACWGGLMSTRAMVLGALGVVVDGNVRDLNEHRDMGFPVSISFFFFFYQKHMVQEMLQNPWLTFYTLKQVFAKNTSALGSNTFTRASEVNVPVRFTSDAQKQPLTINPGDLIVADVDGVVVVPVECAERCLEICEQRFEVDEKTMAALKAGEPMGATLARLRK